MGRFCSLILFLRVKEISSKYKKQKTTQLKGWLRRKKYYAMLIDWLIIMTATEFRGNYKFSKFYLRNEFTIC